LVSGTAEIVTVSASPTTDEALDPRNGSCNRNTWDIEQLGSLELVEAPSFFNGDIQDMEQPENQYRPINPDEEEIMGIYDDGIYCPLDMTEKTEGLHTKGSSIRDGRSCFLQASPHHPVMKAYSGFSSLPRPSWDSNRISQQIS